MTGISEEIETEELSSYLRDYGIKKVVIFLEEENGKLKVVGIEPIQ